MLALMMFSDDVSDYRTPSGCALHAEFGGKRKGADKKFSRTIGFQSVEFPKHKANVGAMEWLLPNTLG